MIAVFVLKYVLLFISAIGLSAICRVVLKVNRFCAPLTAASAVIVVNMLFGMVGLLLPACIALIACGVLGFIYVYIIKRQRPDWAVAIAVAIYFVYLVTQFSDYTVCITDDVSHWGVVSRYLAENNVLPDSTSNIVFFESYPTGTAAFIYFPALILGYSERVAIITQELLNGLAYLCAFSVVKKHKGAAVALFTFLFIFLSGQLEDNKWLHVDYLIGYMAAAVCTQLIAASDDEVPPPHHISIVLPACALVFIKTSGLLFAVCASLGYIYVTRSREKPIKRLSVLLLPLLMFGLWQIYSKLTFPYIDATRHTVSISRYMSVDISSSLDIIKSVLSQLVMRHIKPGGNIITIYAFLFASAAIIALFSRGERRSKLFKMLATALCIYIFWQAALAFTYIFSMSEEEALRLASYARYNKTLSILLIILLSCLMWNTCESTLMEKKHADTFVRVCACACCVMSMLVGLFTDSRFMPYISFHGEYIEPNKETLTEIAAEYPDLKGQDMLVFYISDGTYNEQLDTYFMCNTVKYVFYVPDATAVSVFEDKVYAYSRTAQYDEKGILMGLNSKSGNYSTVSDVLSDLDNDFKAAILLTDVGLSDEELKEFSCLSNALILRP